MSEQPSNPPAVPRWQKLFGVRRRVGARIFRWRLTRWGKLLAVGLVLLVAMGALGEYSMQPAFCRSCHIMEPYYKAWHESSHKNVPCVDCHFEPGVKNTLYGKFQASSQAVKYITATYGSKPHAEIRDVSCLRSGCHETRLLQGKVEWKVPSERMIQTEKKREDGTSEVVLTQNVVTIKFDHTPHLQQERRGKQLRCVSCHSQLVQGRHIVVTTDTCFLCHFKGLKHGRDDATVGTCKGCHEAPKGTIRLATGSFTHSEYVGKGVLCQNCHADTIRGDGAVPQQVCWNCHNQPQQIARYGEPNILHKAHVSDHKVECSSCHVQIEHSLTAGAREETKAHAKLLLDAGTCGQCHEQSHLGPRELYRGIGGRGVPEMASPMSRARVNCIACHMGKKNDGLKADVVGQTFVATQERCDHCHQEKYKGALDDWRKSLAANLTKAEAALAGARADVAKAALSDEARLQTQRLLDDAAYNIRFVKLGHGVHNVTYATALLNKATEWCGQARTLAKGGQAQGR